MPRPLPTPDLLGSDLPGMLDPLRSQLEESRLFRESSQRNLDHALAVLTETISNHWDTGGGYRLRRFIWSLWNDQHLISLSELRSGIDPTMAQAVATVFAAHLSHALTEEHVRKVLSQSGEFIRWDKAREQTPDAEYVNYPPQTHCFSVPCDPPSAHQGYRVKG